MFCPGLACPDRLALSVPVGLFRKIKTFFVLLIAKLSITTVIVSLWFLLLILTLTLRIVVIQTCLGWKSAVLKKRLALPRTQLRETI